MKNLEKVSQLFQDAESVKVISSVSKTGQVHSIAAGSIMAIDDNTMAVAEIFMNVTSSNLKDNQKVALLGVKGMESYLVNATVEKRHTDGQLFDTIVEKFAAMNIPVKALWTFTIDEIYDQSASPNAGTRLF